MPPSALPRGLARWLRLPLNYGNPGTKRLITNSVGSPLASAKDLHYTVTSQEIFNNGRYRAIQKLGQGLYSSVWLARDLQVKRYVALKVLRADCYGSEHDVFELEILQDIRQHLNQYLSSSHRRPSQLPVLDLLDHFQHTSKSGRVHMCLVSPVLGSNLDKQASLFRGYRIPWRAMKDITRQLLHGLRFLHDTCQIIHTDLQPSNICFELDTKFEQEVARLLRPSSTSDLQSFAGQQHLEQQDLSSEDKLQRFIEDMTRPITERHAPSVTIIDFGVACWTHRRLSERIQPEHLRAPEVILGAPWGTKIDVWSLGCLVIEFMQGHLAFKGSANVDLGWTSEDDHLAKYMEVMGPMPQSLLSRSRRAEEFFNRDGSLRRIRKLFPAGLYGYLADPKKSPVGKPPGMPDEELHLFLDFLSRMLALDPDERWSAAMLLEHEWMNHER